jgi:hypothetical protein
VRQRMLANGKTDAFRFIDEAYKHGKAIAASAEGVDLVKESKTGKFVDEENAAEQGVLLACDAKSLSADFIEAIAMVNTRSTDLGF